VTQEWEYHPSPDLEESVAQRLARFPREPTMLSYGVRSAAALALRAWLHTYHRLAILGRENLPDEGSFILVGNHSSHLDALALTASIPLKKLHRTFPAAATDYFFSSLPRSAVAAIFINALPFDRHAGSARSLTVCERLLARPGNILVIFPEGTRSTTGEMGRFLPGIGRLAAGKPIPVIPAYLHGAARALPKGSALPRPCRLSLRLGEPREYGDLPPNRESIRRITAELQEAVTELGRCSETQERSA
jgi:1-acyl-sn-glycerol-3-phosphate acyltransferase